MKSTLNRDNYRSLLPKQRLIAALMAKARDDLGEIEKLHRTCPRYVYSLMDPTYVDAIEHIARVAQLVASLIANEESRLSVLEMLSKPIRTAFNALTDLNVTSATEVTIGNSEDVDTYPLVAMSVIHEFCVLSILVYWDAWERFCRDYIGIDPQLGAYGSMPKDVAEKTLSSVSRSLTQARRQELASGAPTLANSNLEDLLPNGEAFLQAVIQSMPLSAN